MKYTRKQIEARRGKVYQSLYCRYSEEDVSDPIFLENLKTFAAGVEERDRLQEYVDENGVTMEVDKGRQGIIEVLRPEMQLLKAVRESLLRNSRYLLKKTPKKDDDDGDDLIK